jgi:hypothetical protein
MMRPLQATISGYAGRPASVLAALDDETGILIVSASVEARARHPGSLLIHSDPRADRDMLFGLDRLQEAIAAYFALRQRPAPDGQGTCLRFSARANAADPIASIESDGLDVTGPRYRLSPDIDNPKVATLALCLYAQRQPLVEATVDFADDLNRLLHGEAVTI